MSLGLDKINGNLTHRIDLSPETQFTLYVLAGALVLGKLLDYLHGKK